MGFLRKLFGKGRKSKPNSPAAQSSSTFPPAQQGGRKVVFPDPFHGDDEIWQAVRNHINARAASGDPQFQAIMRIAALNSPERWLADNFPPEKGHAFFNMGPLPRAIEYLDEDDAGQQKTVVIPQEDTSITLAGKGGGGMVAVCLVALPPKGVGEPETAGTPMARGTLGTKAMDAAEKALLGFLHEMQDRGMQGSRPLGEQLDGCMAVVIMGVDMLIYEYTRKKGFYDPPEGWEHVVENADPERYPPIKLPLKSGVEKKGEPAGGKKD